MVADYRYRVLCLLGDIMLYILRRILLRLLTTANIFAYVATIHAAVPTPLIDSFTGTISVNTEPMEHDNGCSGVLGCLFNQDQYLIRLSGTLNREKTIPSHCLVVQYAGDEWAFFAGAHDRTGTALNVAVIDRRLGRPFSLSGVTEVFCVRLSKPYLRGLQGKPLVLRLEGNRKSFVINVPAELLEDYLKAVADWVDTPLPLAARKVVLGVQYLTLNRAALAPLQVDADFGHMVTTVAPGSLAERSGLRAGDIILAVDDLAVGNAQNLADIAQGWSSSKPGKLAVNRAGQPLEIAIPYPPK